ncbi:MAG TPA: malonate decarboxylase acyl carrier protein [Steroidobacteraceae bacterium]|jgi:malonate decarboxylase delta subunit|nr:malonate decarboxylase acyl carrier protein [Steroidobacteraceae bacterium]
MESLKFQHQAARRLPGARRQALLGVVASGNLEALFERTLTGVECRIEVLTSISGYAEVWSAVIADFVERYSPGGLLISIHDGGARPDTVALRLAQGARVMEREDA